MQTQTAEQKQGFEGAILGLPLADILQLKQQNHFTGCITVTNASRRGRLFFRNGTVIHAELPGCEGEEACYRMLAWSGGRFQIDTKVETARQTIDKPLSFLLLEACRRIDEDQADQETPAAGAPANREVSAYVTSVLEAFRKIPEVNSVVVTNRQGQLQMADGEMERKLATDGEFLALIGHRLGQLLNLGDLQLAAYESLHQQVVAVRNRKQALHVAFCPDKTLTAVQDIVRTTLKSLKKA